MSGRPLGRRERERASGSRRRVRALAACALVVLLVVPTGVVAVEGEPTLSATLADNRVVAGEETTLRIRIANTGELEEAGTDPADEARVLTARGVRASLDSGTAPVSVESGTVSVGSIPDGGVVDVEATIRVDDDADPGRYRVPVEVRYVHTEEIDEASGDRDEAFVRETLYVGIRVVAAPRFVVVDAETDAPVGESGSVSVVLRNVGSDDARDARVTVASRSGELLVGANGTVSRFVGRWEVDETRTVDVPATVRADAGRRNYTVVSRVTYAGEAGASVRSPPLAAGVVPAREQGFDVRDAAASLYVGERGTLTATVVNDGPETARDVVVRLDPPTDAVIPLRGEYAVGTLDPDESATVEFPVRLTDGAEPGPVQFDTLVTYRTADGDRREADPAPVRAAVAPDRDLFSLDPTNATLAPDSSNRVVVRVTNAGDAARTDVTVALAPTPPFTSVSPAAYVGDLAPGESASAAFEVSVDEDAVESTHALAANVTSESAAGDARIVESHTVPLVVAVEPTRVDTVTLVAVVGLGVAVVAGVGYWWFRRR